MLVGWMAKQKAGAARANSFSKAIADQLEV
jgi:hypothetical protein